MPSKISVIGLVDVKGVNPITVTGGDLDKDGKSLPGSPKKSADPSRSSSGNDHLKKADGV